VLAERAERESRSHTVSLPRLVERTLADAGLQVGDVQGLAVSIGPGSFTGLRIGLAFAKGLAYAGRVPLAAVSTLEALAWAADAPPGVRICAALDARKQEVYAALFEATCDGPRRLGADVALRPAALARLLDAPCVLVGDAGEVYADVLGARADVRPFATHHPRGGIVARLGAARLARGDVADVGALEPTYVRAPEAELAAARARVN